VVGAAAGGLDYDEMVSGAGGIRSAWQPLVGALQAMPKGAFAERVARVARQHEDISSAYNLEGAAVTSQRRPFDLVPMLVAAEEWPALEAGLAQRARLFDLLLADLYGPRRLVAEGRLPPALFYGNPRYLRACVGVPLRGPERLHAYAADLVRQPDGSWRVLSDRLQAPAGIGFALQNRNILARSAPELFRAHTVQRIEPFVEMWRDALSALSPRQDAPPRVGVMTPGPFNAAYFEHVYLAQQLGATLVEGADLTMRDNRVFVKTLGVLQPIDVILRFMEDEYCDPLELRETSVLGVAGLLQAVRAGTVTIANALGASVAEAPALRAFLPGLAQHLLGETLAIPSVDSFWLGEAGGVERLADLPADVQIKLAFGTRREEQIFAEQMQRLGRDAILADVRRRPYLYITEPPVRRSMLPVWTPDGLVPQPLTLRMFLVRDGDTYRAMPGGFAQVPHDTGGQGQPTVMSKDTWVLVGEGDGGAPVPRQPSSARVLRRPAEELRSRTADDLFWLGRYAERLDNAARLLRSAVLRLAVDRYGPGQRQDLRYLVQLMVEGQLLDGHTLDLLHDSNALLTALSADCSRGRAVLDLFHSIHRIAQALRDRLSNDMWNVVIGRVAEARDTLQQQSYDADRLIGALDNLIGVIAAFGGMAAENMTRGSGWRFLDIGRRLERGVYGMSVLKEVLASPPHEAEAGLSLALELFDSSITYRARYLGAIQAGPVFDLVLADQRNPRGVKYQLITVVEHLRELAASFGRVGTDPDLALAGGILMRIQQANPATLDETADARAREAMALLLGQARLELHQLSDAITRAYFSHVRVPYAIGYSWTRL
jgi:uncharacterized circularly permuted ATP-grasp superfamily protein/uncharacterized alpha-E superfamily protein